MLLHAQHHPWPCTLTPHFTPSPSHTHSSLPLGHHSHPCTLTLLPPLPLHTPSTPNPSPLHTHPSLNSSITSALAHSPSFHPSTLTLTLLSPLPLHTHPSFPHHPKPCTLTPHSSPNTSISFTLTQTPLPLHTYPSFHPITFTHSSVIPTCPSALALHTHALLPLFHHPYTCTLTPTSPQPSHTHPSLSLTITPPCTLTLVHHPNP